MKRLSAFVAATFITGIVALGMVAIGLNALFDPPVQAASAAAPDAAAVVDQSRPDQATTAQLLKEIAQYQSREKDYQQQLDQANGEIQQLQAVLAELSQRGVIRITPDGQIQLRRGGLGGGD